MWWLWLNVSGSHTLLCVWPAARFTCHEAAAAASSIFAQDEASTDQIQLPPLAFVAASLSDCDCDCDYDYAVSQLERKLDRTSETAAAQ